MEMVMPRAPTSPDFHFTRSTSPSPYATAPSSPKPFGNADEYVYCYTSAPTSPTRASAVRSYFTGDLEDWEAGTLSPKPGRNDQFNFPSGLGGQEKEIAAADELFDRGKIKPVRPPQTRPGLPPKSPRGEEKVIDATKERGRGEAQSSRSRRGTRSLSPNKEPVSTSTASTASAPAIKSSGSKKWRLRDLFLFRSASEGRATGRGSKDPLNKYTLLSASFSKGGGGQDKKSSTSSKSMERKGSSSVSAHELHYTANRAASEEKKKKTPLPYHRNTLFGCLHFNPAVKSITRGFDAYSFNQGRS